MDLQIKHHIEQARALSNIDTTYSDSNLNLHESNFEKKLFKVVVQKLLRNFKNLKGQFYRELYYLRAL